MDKTSLRATKLPTNDRTHIAISLKDKNRFQRLAGGQYDWQAFREMLDFYEKHSQKTSIKTS